MNKDPIKQFVLLVLLQAQQDHATKLVISSASGDKPPIKYKVDGSWYELSTPPSHILPDIMAELGRLAKLTNGAKNGEICTVVAAVRLRWRVTVASGDTGFVLTPIAG